MSFDPDIVIRKATELKRAEELVRQLKAELIAILRDQDAKTTVGNPIGVSTLVRADWRAHSTPERVVELLNANPDKTFLFSEIFNAIGGNEGSLRSLVAKLINDNKIRRQGWGKYMANLPQKEKAQSS